jgi:hypothetical protein
MHLPGVPPEDHADILAQLRRPEGTVRLGATFPRIHEPDATGILFEVVSGGHIFRLVRHDQVISGYHSSPGTGTRVATVPLSPVSPSETLDFWLAWSPDEFRLVVVDPSDPERIVSAEHTESPVGLWVAADGTIVEVGSSGVAVAAVRGFAGGTEIIAPPAIELWRDTVRAVTTLLSGESSEGYVFETVLSNAALVMLTTGFETYCEERFAEIEREGVPVNAEATLEAFGTVDERRQLKAGGTPALIADARSAGTSLASALTRRINFQNFPNSKRAYNRGYALKFGNDLGLTSQSLDRIQRLLDYRHRVVHVSPLIGMLNQPEVPPNEPEFSNRAFAESAMSDFDDFITALHDATLRLRP